MVGGRKKQGNNYATLATYQLCGASAAMGPITCTASTGGIAGRYAHDAVALGPDGSKVLVAGGTSGNSDLATAGLYDASTGTWTSTGLGSLTPARSDLTLTPVAERPRTCRGWQQQRDCEEGSRCLPAAVRTGRTDEHRAYGRIQRRRSSMQAAP